MNSDLPTGGAEIAAPHPGQPERGRGVCHGRGLLFWRGVRTNLEGGPFSL